MLPRLDAPKYMITLPLSQKKIEYRPFVVKEQRNLLMALESEDPSNIQRAVKEILTKCTVTPGIDIQKLPIIDVEYYFLQLRGKSAGEVVDLRYKCNNEVNGKTCNNVMSTQVNVTDIQVERKEDIKTEIQLTDQIMIKLRYPDFSFIEDSLKFENVNDLTFYMVARSIEYIYDGEQYYYSNEVDIKEMIDFVENMSQSQFEKIEEFFASLPKMRKKINLTCKKCGFNHNIVAEGLESFFG